MRVGELKALKWSDIDFGGRLIEVQRGERKGILSDTKNHKRRRIDMTPQLAETLQDLKLTQQKRALKRGGPFPNGCSPMTAAGYSSGPRLKMRLKNAWKTQG